MKDFENIEDWYREEVNNYKVEPDKNGWNSLSEDLDANTPLTNQNISEWYKKEVSKLEERPDFTVWEKLSTKLDTASVWDKLSVSLDRYALFLWWRNMAIRGSAILLLLLGSYLTYSNYKESPIPQSSAQSKNLKQTHYGFTSLLGMKYDNANTFSKAYDTSNNNNLSSSTTQQKAVHLVSKLAKHIILNKNPQESPTILASKNNINFYNKLSVENFDFLKSPTKRDINYNLNYPSISEKDISTHVNSKEFLVKKDNNKILFNKRRFTSRTNNGIQTKRLYAGANIGLKKQGMFTSYIESTFLKNYKKKSLLDFGTNFGAIIGVIVSDNLSIESNIIFNSTSGHKRLYSHEDRSFDEQLKINYTSASIIAKKTNNRSTFDNRLYSTNFFGGAYISKLRTEKSTINDIELDINQFNNIDYGLIIGVEQDRYISNNIVITPGLRYNQGIANITNENSAFKSARNFSIELNIGIKYIFSK